MILVKSSLRDDFLSNMRNSFLLSFLSQLNTCINKVFYEILKEHIIYSKFQYEYLMNIDIYFSIHDLTTLQLFKEMPIETLIITKDPGGGRGRVDKTLVSQP